MCVLVPVPHPTPFFWTLTHNIQTGSPHSKFPDALTCQRLRPVTTFWTLEVFNFVWLFRWSQVYWENTIYLTHNGVCVCVFNLRKDLQSRFHMKNKIWISGFSGKTKEFGNTGIIFFHGDISPDLRKAYPSEADLCFSGLHGTTA